MENHETNGNPISSLEQVPIDLPYLERILSILTSHGATLTETRDCTENPGETYGNYKEFTIDFPEGTKRLNGLTRWQSQPFVLYFPDGYELHATQTPDTIILEFRDEEVL